tara:strand:- start:134 stop:388 length:255 start_codon:yes stop_codon:yes gene_type:complete
MYPINEARMTGTSRVANKPTLPVSEFEVFSFPSVSNITASRRPLGSHDMSTISGEVVDASSRVVSTLDSITALGKSTGKMRASR